MAKFVVHAEFSSTVTDAGSPEDAIKNVFGQDCRVTRIAPERNDHDQFMVESPRFGYPVYMKTVKSS